MTSKQRKIIEENFHIKLTDEDIVHHIDLDKKNNDISNLWLTDKKTHWQMHSNCYKIMVILLKQALDKEKVIFDNGEYKFRSHLKSHMKKYMEK